MTDALALPSRAVAVLDRVRYQAATIATVVGLAPLTTPEVEAQAGELLRLIKTLEGEAEAERRLAKAPHLAAGRAVDDAFRVPLGELARVETLLRGRLAEAAEARDLARREAQAALLAAVREGDAERANAAAIAVDDPVFSPVAGISERWTYEVTGVTIREVPITYLALDMERVRAEIRAALAEGREPSIPGVRFERRAALTVRKIT